MVIPQIEVRRFTPGGEADFWRVHDEGRGCGWCACVAWWVDSWQGWAERTAAQNRTLRSELLERGEYDGYLLFVDDEPVGWCQAGVRDRLVKLVRQYDLDPDPETWALTCFLIQPAHRRRGLAGRLLAGVLAYLARRGVRRVEAFPKREAEPDAMDLWTGPESAYTHAGFKVVRDDPRRPILAFELRS